MTLPKWGNLLEMCELFGAKLFEIFESANHICRKLPYPLPYPLHEDNETCNRNLAVSNAYNIQLYPINLL